MSILKCKMCGGDLEIAEGLTIAECEYCCTKQTVPKAMDENLQGLFNRANTLRIKSEFDKAEKLYEKIIQTDPTQAEAYWGLILCKYGIEYVDDPATFKKVPTCHRASFESIVSDEDYKSALENADLGQRAIYEEQAKEIDRIQKDILALAQKEESYDVFICYKETDANGQRTQDSAIANDIYHQLTQEGFKVFYAAITLEGKLGSAYEPIIFAALNSAKVMLAIGTKPEYFNAVWVKNEWSRYLKIIKTDCTKLLIPCYRDMDAYEFPEEFAHLQAQNMSKIGFINDIVRGIRKVLKKDEPKEPVVKETVVTSVNVSAAPLLKRAFMFLEDGDWKSADEYCEKVLDIDPENAEAYLGKLMAELRVKTKADLKNCAQPFDGSNNYQKALRFGDEELSREFADCIKYIDDRNENTRLAEEYEYCVSAMKTAKTEDDYISISVRLSKLGDYQDCATKIKDCIDKAEAERVERERRQEISQIYAQRRAKRERQKIIVVFSVLVIVASFLIILVNVIIPNVQYAEALMLMKTGEYKDAMVAFGALNGYKDSLEKINECNVAICDGKYNNAITLMNTGDVIGAYETFISLDGYKDSIEKAASIYDRYNIEKLRLSTIGDYVFIGMYEQDNNFSNGKEEIEWQVLDKKGSKILIVSKYALECWPYNTNQTDVTWETCTLRKRLNDNFFNSAFSEVEKSVIVMENIPADKNNSFAVDPGNATQDKIFVLSATEVKKYYGLNGSGDCEPTEYAKACGAYTDSNGNCCWWIRTPGRRSYMACRYVRGGIYSLGDEVNYNIVSVRPAMWLDMNP